MSTIIYKKILVFFIVLLCFIIPAPKEQQNLPRGKPKIKTIESQLSKPTKKLIKQINKTAALEKKFPKYSIKTYNELIGYLNSKEYIEYNNGIYVTNTKAVKRRIASVKKVNKILYKRVKKLYKGKNIKTLEAFEYYIEDKITYYLPNPDMYKNMRYGTCVAYASMLKAMCDMAGIPCKIYAGWATPQDGHCWNRVKLRGKWLWCDICWDDNTICGDTSYLHQRSLWYDHWDYKPLSIYRVLLSY